jgi:hypothetical protein
MKIEVNEKTFRGMASRLREESNEELKNCESFEKLSRILGFKNWDTLSGLLKRGQQVALTLERPLTLYVEAFACDEYGESPTWAKLTINQEFVDALLRLQGVCKSNNLHMVSEYWPVDAWQDDDNYRMRGETLEVTDGNWWIKAYPKHVDYNCETRMIGVKELVEILDGSAPLNGRYWVRKGDVLVYDSSGEASRMLDSLIEEGELQE